MFGERKGYIDRSITTIKDAQTSIIDDARRRVCALDWKHFNLSPQRVVESYELAYPYALATCTLIGQALPFFVLNEDNPEHIDIMLSLPDDRIMQLENTKYYLALLQTLSPDWATFLRDYLWTKTPENIASLNYINIESLNDYFLRTHGEFMGMAQRYITLCTKLGIPLPD